MPGLTWLMLPIPIVFSVLEFQFPFVHCFSFGAIDARRITLLLIADTFPDFMIGQATQVMQTRLCMRAT
jgi:hypothetical protein